MKIIAIAIERPIAVLAGVLVLIMFGLLALKTIPVQLTPDIRKPVITIQTRWAAAAPAEVEREILIRQEEVLKGLEGLEKISGTASQGRSEITLEFALSQDMSKALLLVANRLDRVNNYPQEVDKPILQTAGSEDNPIAWFNIRPLNPTQGKPIHQYGDLVEEFVRERLDRINGVGGVNVFGGSEQELQVIVDPAILARQGVTVDRLMQALRQANVSISAGDIDEGKRRYVVRSEAELNSPEQIRKVVVRSSGVLGQVLVGDIAQVRFGYKEPTARIRLNGEPALALNVVRDAGANVIEVMDRIKQTVAELNQSILAQYGLVMRQTYDETVYIQAAVNLVQQNIVVGGGLAILILMIFLRSWRATLVVALAIPVSVIGAFVAMAFLGRSLNVISLAGIAFAVGMVVDAAIVVLENIYRLREQGYSAAQAALQGANQVWGAIFVSALTTVLVFIPLLVLDLEVGQLFRDIAVAISVSVVLSLLVSITVIPALAKYLLAHMPPKTQQASPNLGQRLLAKMDQQVAALVAALLRWTRWVVSGRVRSVAMVLGMTGLALWITWVAMPKLEYLPEGNRNLIFGIILPPPGYNLATMTDIAGLVEDQVSPLWQKNRPSDAKDPTIDYFFFVALSGRTFLGAAAEDSSRVKELVPIMNRAAFTEPGTFGFVNQRSLFGRGIGGSRSLELDISGPDLPDLLSVAQQAMSKINGILPRSAGHQIRPQPGLELGVPELRVIPDLQRLAESGLTARQLAESVDIFNDGARVDEVAVGDRRIDLTLKGLQPPKQTTQDISYLPVVLEDGRMVPVSALAKVELTAGPTQIRHRERQRTVTLEVQPASLLPLEQAMEMMENQVIKPLQAAGLPDGVSLRLAGTADELTRTWQAMVGQLLVALAVVYLIMAVLFESFRFPLVIMLAVPLATAGAMLGLGITNWFRFQPLDMLTLLGFVILIGIVVNNAILLVHQTLYHVRQEKMPALDAIVEATRNRVRPIFMSTLTSTFGMLPLALYPGAGSELYRGLGTVVLSGLSLSAVLTLLVVPPMLALVLPKDTPEPSS